MSQWTTNLEDQQRFSGRRAKNVLYNANMDEEQPTHGLPAANWRPPSADFEGPSVGVAFQGRPYFNPHPYAHPYHPQSSQVAGVTHGLLNWEHSQQAAPPAHPFGYSGTNNNSVVASRGGDDELHRTFRRGPDEGFQPAARFLGPQATGMPETSAPSGQVNLTRRLDEMEERSQEEQKQRLRLESKVDENAQTLANILKELKALRPQTVAVAPANQVSKRRAQPSLQGELSKRAKTAHSDPAGADQSDSGSDSLPSVQEARSTAVFRPRPEAQQPQQPQQQQQGEAAADSAEPPSAPSPPAVEAAAPPPIDNDSNNAPDLRWAREFLAFLKRMDCRSDRELLSLKKCVKGRVSFDFPLCTDSPTRRTKTCYFLKVGGSLSTTLTPNPDNRPPGQPGPAREEVEHLNIYETYLDQRCAAATNGALCAFHPPKYVVPLGEVYRACRSSDGPGEVASTNFLVFMDVTGPRKGLWLMYRYEKAVEDRDRVQWRPVSIHNERDSVFSSSVRAFDAVCLLEDVKDWKGPAEDMIGMGRFGEALPDEQVIVHAAFYTPVLEKMREVLRKGWTPAVDREEEEEE